MNWWLIVWLVVLTAAYIIICILWYMNIDTLADMATKLGYLENRVKTLEEKMKRCFNYMHETTNDLFKLNQKVENMTNAEKYKKEIRNEHCYMACAVNRVKNKRGSSEKCPDNCSACKSESIAWLMQEYEEPPVDWSKVKPNTSILVKFTEDAPKWIERNFAFYINDTVWYQNDGRLCIAPFAKLKD